MPNLIIALVLVLAGGGASVAAQSARPGDLLYGMKTGVNERLEVAFAGSATARAEADARIAARRLVEAEEVVVKGDLSADTRLMIEENFKAHAERVRARIDEFGDKELNAAADILVNFETSLEVHQRILAELELQVADSSERDQIRDLDKDVDDEEQKTQGKRMEVEAKVTGQAGPMVQVAAEGKLKAAEHKIAEVKNYITLRQGKVASVADAEARVAIAEQAVVDGKARLAASAYAEAFMLFSDAHRIAQEAKLLLEVDVNLNGDLNLRAEIHGLGVEISAEADETEEERMDREERGEMGREDEEGDDDAEAGAGAGANVNAPGANVNVNVNANVNLGN